MYRPFTNCKINISSLKKLSTKQLKEIEPSFTIFKTKKEIISFIKEKNLFTESLFLHSIKFNFCPNQIKQPLLGRWGYKNDSNPSGEYPW